METGLNDSCEHAQPDPRSVAPDFCVEVFTWFAGQHVFTLVVVDSQHPETASGRHKQPDESQQTEGAAHNVSGVAITSHSDIKVR
ncbi:MAG: hypothetical protein O2955_03880 [Planctomycetota bacterium]|nr:hypothetical protein [Planctomycetota bacterium]MDA1211628.1 hypothetical protein [Planctomycetota bacterium]